jgi:thiol-disulfide isomerase/thioredoxin
MSLNPKSRIFLMVFAMLGAAVLSYVLLMDARPLPSGEKISAAPPVVASLPAARFFDAEGQAQTLADYKGRVVLVNLWAVWCPPCVVELPDLDRLHAAMKGKDFKLLPIAVGKHEAQQIQTFFDDKGLDHLGVFIDSEREIMSKWPVGGLPVSFLIDRDGTVVEKFDGIRDWSSPEMMAKIKVLL